MANINIEILEDNRLFPSVFNIYQMTNNIDVATYTMEHYIIYGEKDLSTYDWYAVLIGVNGLDEVKLTTRINSNNQLEITFNLNEYITRLGNKLTYQLVAKDSIGSVFITSKGIILNAESIKADDFIVANCPSILKQWENRILDIITEINNLEIELNNKIEENKNELTAEIRQLEEELKARVEELAGSFDSAVFYMKYGETIPLEERLPNRLYYQYITANNDEGQFEDHNGNVLSTNSSGSGGLPLLSFNWYEHLLNDVSFVRADTFSWQDGDIYISAYNELLKEYNSDECVEEVENGVVYKRTPNKYKICSADQELNVANAYDTIGVAWFYILDIENKRFKLPRNKFGFVGLRNGVGNFVNETLPNITDSVDSMFGMKGTNEDSALSKNITQSNLAGATGSGAGYGTLTLNANLSNPVYQDNAPVQQKATEMYLYFYVGNSVRKATEIDIGKLSEKINDLDINVISQEVNEVKNNALSEIETAGEVISSYQQPIIQEKITNLEVNKIYSMTIEEDTTFVLPTEVNTNYFNQIKLMINYVSGTVDFGTTNYFNKTAFELEAGYYDIYFDYDNHLNGWVVGAISKGEVV